VQVDTAIGPVELSGPTASLSGNGTVDTLSGAGSSPAIGTVSPGVGTNGVGILHSATTTWGTQTTFLVNLNSAAGGPGTGYDQLRVTGDIFLGGATLSGVVGAGIVNGDSFTIIQTTGGTVHGTFTGPGFIFLSGQKFTIDSTTDPTKVVLTK